MSEMTSITALALYVSEMKCGQEMWTDCIYMDQGSHFWKVPKVAGAFWNWYISSRRFMMLMMQNCRLTWAC